MRTLIMLLLLLLSAAGSAAQDVDLTPLKLLYKGDTVHAFTQVQAQQILKRLTQLQYRDRTVSSQALIIQQHEASLVELTLAVEKKEQTLALERDRTKSREALIREQQALLQAQDAVLVQQREQIRKLKGKNRFLKTLGGVSLGLLTLFSLAK